MDIGRKRDQKPSPTENPTQILQWYKSFVVVFFSDFHS